MASEDWKSYFCRVNDVLASIAVDVTLAASAPNAARPFLLWAWIDFQMAGTDGLSNSAEAPTLWKIEDALCGEMAARCDARLAGKITTSGRRELYFYGSKTDGLQEAVRKAFAEHPGYVIWSDAKTDASWRQYFDVLYPSARDRERIKNGETVDALQAAGDRLEAARPVTHRAAFTTASDRARFVARTQALGFAVSTSESSSDVPYPFGVRLERIDLVDWRSVDEISLGLYDLVIEHGGDYDGWESHVITSTPPREE